MGQASSGVKRLRVAVIIGDERIHQVGWPPEFDVRPYTANEDDARKVVKRAESGGLDWIVYHPRFSKGVARILKGQSKVRVIPWENSALALSRKMHEVLGQPPPPSTPKEPAKVIPMPKKAPARAWTEEERRALAAAWHEAGADMSKFVDGYLGRTETMGVAPRTTAEMREELQRIQDAEADAREKRAVVVLGTAVAVTMLDPSEDVDVLYPRAREHTEMSRDEFIAGYEAAKKLSASSMTRTEWWVSLCSVLRAVLVLEQFRAASELLTDAAASIGGALL